MCFPSLHIRLAPASSPAAKSDWNSNYQLQVRVPGLSILCVFQSSVIRRQFLSPELNSFCVPKHVSWADHMSTLYFTTCDPSFCPDHWMTVTFGEGATWPCVPLIGDTRRGHCISCRDKAQTSSLGHRFVKTHRPFTQSGCSARGLCSKAWSPSN